MPKIYRRSPHLFRRYRGCGIKGITSCLGRGSTLWLLGSLLGWTPVPSKAAEASPEEVLHAYVLMAYSPILDQTVPLVRAILGQPTSACPEIRLSGGGPAIPMVLRNNPNPAAFGVSVCEAVVQADSPTFYPIKMPGWEGPLPVPPKEPKTLAKIVVVGDSGCKGGDQQICSGGGISWPFPQVTSAAAAGSPDLVIHLGDYNYRGTPNKTEEGQWSYDGCVPEDWSPLVRQSSYDTWVTWSEDFFTAAQPLLNVAPWVVVRGNHELCSRGGQGWFYFLDPHSPLLDPYTRPLGCDAPTALTQPYKLSFENLDLVVLDTANACGGEDPENAAGTAYEVHGYKLQFATVDSLLSPRSDPKSTWLLGHRPVWSLGKWGSSPPSTENTTLQAALAFTASGQLPSPVKMVLSGHMHQFFSMSFEGHRPPQLVIGNSGVLLSGNELASPYSLTVDGLPAAGLSNASGANYGYLEAAITDGENWTGTVYAFDASGKPQSEPVALCGLPLTKGRLCREP